VLKTYRWPNSVAFPDEDLALVQIPQTERNATGRLRVREVLREILSNWAGHPVALEESVRGPIVQGFIRGETIEVSLSYAGGDAWVAIRSDGSVGMDAVLVGDAPDWEAVAELYLGDNAVQEIRDAEHRGSAFAERWAALEARCKLAKLPLREKTQPPPAPIFTLRVGDLIICIAMSLAEEKGGKTQLNPVNPLSGRTKNLKFHSARINFDSGAGFDVNSNER